MKLRAALRRIAHLRRRLATILGAAMTAMLTFTVYTAASASASPIVALVNDYNPTTGVAPNFGPFTGILVKPATIILSAVWAGGLFWAVMRVIFAIPKVSLARGQGNPWNEHIGNQEVLGAIIALILTGLALPIIGALRSAF